jgi:hypothetical protein
MLAVEEEQRAAAASSSKDAAITPGARVFVATTAASGDIKICDG